MPKTKVVFLSSLLHSPYYSTRSPRRTLILDMPPPDMEVVGVDNTLPDSQKIPLCKDADAIIASPADVSINLLRACPKVKLIQTLGTGGSALDLKAIGELGIPVATNHGNSAISVSEHIIALMLVTSRHFVRYWQSAKNRHWTDGAQGLDNYEVTGKTVGIVGLGNIGKQVAKHLKGFDCNVIYYARGKTPVSVSEQRELNVRLVPLEELLRTSDIVIPLVRLNSATHHMIGRRELAMMKPSAILINASRGAVVDERALYEALTTGKIRGAGLDVLEEEPTPKENPLLGLDNVVITPHVAGNTMEKSVRTAEFAFENIRRVMEGKAPESLFKPAA